MSRLLWRPSQSGILLMFLLLLLISVAAAVWQRWEVGRPQRGKRWESLATVTVPLRLMIPKEKGEDGWFFSIPQYFNFQTKPPSPIRRAPKGARLFSTVSLGNRTWSLALLKSSHKTSDAYDRLVWDQNRNGDLTDDPVHKGTVWIRKSRQGDKPGGEWRVVFRPILLSLPGKDGPFACAVAVQIRGLGTQVRHSRYQTYCYWSGIIPAPLGPMKIALVDLNSDGVVGTERDALLPDLNGDGDPFNDDTRDPFPKLLQFRDHYYQVVLQLKEKGGHLSLSLYRGPMGILSSPHFSHVRLELVSSQWGPLIVTLRDGKAVVPEGTYQIEQWTATPKDENGAVWKLTAYALTDLKEDDGRLRIEIQKEALTRLPISDTVRPELTVRGKDLSFEFDLKVAVGPFWVSALTRNGKMPPEPVLKIVDETGRLVSEQKFHYG
ncbi:MAG: hypothetical protein NZ959_10635 [Armatimonadetes bacterium]|nr:hypothetical protein [Armatimonadota bacterium]